MGAAGGATKRIARVLAVTGLVAGFLVAAPARRASASCVAIPSRPEAVDHAKFAFVGTVVATSNRDRTARVRVDSVWKGARIPHHVVVRGSPASGNAVTSEDREYVKGRKYLFVPYRRPARSIFLDNACSPTSEYTAAVARDAPSTTR
jgi:hypothetical protein